MVDSFRCPLMNHVYNLLKNKFQFNNDKKCICKTIPNLVLNGRDIVYNSLEFCFSPTNDQFENLKHDLDTAQAGNYKLRTENDYLKLILDKKELFIADLLEQQKTSGALIAKCQHAKEFIEFLLIHFNELFNELMIIYNDDTKQILLEELRYLRSEYEHDSREKDEIIDTLMHENCYMKNLLEFEIDLDVSLNQRVLQSLESDIYQLDQDSDRVSEILRFNKYNKEIFEEIGHIINDEENVDIIAEKISAKRINLDLRDKAMNISHIVSSKDNVKAADVSMKSVDILTLKELSAHDQRMVSLENQSGSQSEVDSDNISADGVIDKLVQELIVQLDENVPKIEIVESQSSRSEIQSMYEDLIENDEKPKEIFNMKVEEVKEVVVAVKFEDFKEVKEIEEIEEFKEVDEVKEVEEVTEVDEVKEVEEVSGVEEFEEFDEVEEVEEVSEVEEFDEVEEVEEVSEVEEFDEVEEDEEVWEVKEFDEVEEEEEVSEVEEFQEVDDVKEVEEVSEVDDIETFDEVELVDNDFDYNGSEDIIKEDVKIPKLESTTDLDQEDDVSISLKSQNSDPKCIADTFSNSPHIPDEFDQLRSENENRYLKENVTKLENEAFNKEKILLQIQRLHCLPLIDIRANCLIEITKSTNNIEIKDVRPSNTIENRTCLHHDCHYKFRYKTRIVTTIQLVTHNKNITETSRKCSIKIIYPDFVENSNTFPLPESLDDDSFEISIAHVFILLDLIDFDDSGLKVMYPNGSEEDREFDFLKTKSPQSIDIPVIKIDK